MIVRRTLWFVVLTAIVLGLPSKAAEKSCAFPIADALKSALKAAGGSFKAGASLSSKVGLPVKALIAYFTHPDEERLDAAVHELLKSGAKMVFPTTGMVVTYGRWFLGSREEAGAVTVPVNGLIEMARDYEVDVVAQDFFNTPAMRDKGITYENFTSRIRSADELERLHTLYNGLYSRDLIELNPGPQNEGETKAKLAEGWESIQKKWMLVWAETLEFNLRAAFRHEALVVAAQERKCEEAEAAAPPAAAPGEPTVTLSAKGSTETVKLKLNAQGNYEIDTASYAPSKEIPVDVKEPVTATATVTGLPDPYRMWLSVGLEGPGQTCGPSTSSCEETLGPYPGRIRGYGDGWAATEGAEVWVCKGQRRQDCPADPIAALEINWHL